MTQQDGVKLLNIINTFLNDEENQKLTKWAIIGFGTMIERKIKEIVLRDNPKENKLIPKNEFKNKPKII